MKKIILMMLLLVSITANAQKDVTKFLGIPVDGTKAAMTQKLKAKGFQYNQRLDCLTGEFNGGEVNVCVVTNNNKVWRIMVQDASASSEGDIKIRFNNLCRQFRNNKKYISTTFSDNTLSDSENISYEMLVNKKRYEASYYQAPDPALTDTLVLQQRVREALLQEYTQDEIDNPTDKLAEKMQTIARREAIDYTYELMEKKSVWFMISEQYGRYRIVMFYDNEYNHSDGEDL